MNMLEKYSSIDETELKNIEGGFVFTSVAISIVGGVIIKKVIIGASIAGAGVATGYFVNK